MQALPTHLEQAALRAPGLMRFGYRPAHSAAGRLARRDDKVIVGRVVGSGCAAGGWMPWRGLCRARQS
jgi:hypothetical protein